MTQAFDVPINAALNINQALGIAPGDFFPPRPYLIQNVGEGSLSSSLLYGDYPTAPDPCTAPGHPLGRNQSARVVLVDYLQVYIWAASLGRPGRVVVTEAPQA